MSTSGPVLTRAQIRAVDQLALEEYGIPGVVLMENAGAGAARILLEHEPRRVAILCGPGNNGGDGYVVARHLANEGVEVRVFELVEAARLRGDAAIMRQVVARMAQGTGSKVQLVSASKSISESLANFDWIVDALLGTGFQGEVREPLAAAIRACNEARIQGARVMALDLPSGLDTDSGAAAAETVKADLTATFAALKRGLLNSDAREFVGEVRVVSIGAPLELLERVSREV